MIDDFIIRQISRAELLVGSGQIDEAISTLNEVLKLNPDSTHAHMKLKDVYLRAGMKPQAAEECLQLARIYESQGEKASANDYLVRAGFLSPATGSLSSKPRPIQPVPNGKPSVPTNGSSVSSIQSHSELRTKPDPVRLAGGVQQTATTVRPIPPSPRNVPDVITASQNASPVAPASPVPAIRSSGSDHTIPELSVEAGTRFLKTDLAEIRRAVLGEDLSAGSVLDHDLERFPLHEIDSEPDTAYPSTISAVAPAVSEETPIRVAAVPAAGLITAPLERTGTGRKSRWLYRTAVAVVLLAGTAVAGGFWFNSRLDKQYAALSKEYEAAAYASSYVPERAEIVDVVTPDDSVVVSETEEAQPVPEDTPRNKAEQDLLDRKTAEKQKALAAARLAEQQAPTVVAMKPEARKANPLPPMTSQVPVIGAQTISDNRAAALLMNAGAAMGPPEPPPPAPAPARRLVVSAEATSKAQPSYPRSAANARVSGSVAVLVTISEQGNVTEARATSGPSLLYGAAVDAARRWKFKPSTIGGVPTKTSKTIVFNFKYDKYDK
jgi:TonB family protein